MGGSGNTGICSTQRGGRHPHSVHGRVQLPHGMMILQCLCYVYAKRQTVRHSAVYGVLLAENIAG